MLRAMAMLVGITATAGLATTGGAAAEPLCGDRDMIAERLASEYGEVRHGAGMVGHGRIMEIFISPERGSWTILITHAGGPTCVVAAGESWEVVPVSGVEPGIRS